MPKCVVIDARPIRLLLVTGSRTLDREETELWVSGIIGERIVAVAEDGFVLSGGAEGPDSIALRLADQHLRLWVAYLPSGLRRANYEKERRWSPEAVDPLDRNRALIRAACRARAKDWRVLVLGFVDPKSPTHGTEHTMALARQERLDTERFTWAEPIEKGDTP